MKKLVLSVGKLFAASVFCMVVASCQFSASSESSFSFEVNDGNDEEGYQITGEPDQLLEISDAIMDYLKSAHINDADDAQQFTDAMKEANELLHAASDSINSRMETMTLKEKSVLMNQVSDINDQIEKNNPAFEREIDRLEKEAEEIGITLDLDF